MKLKGGLLLFLNIVVVFCHAQTIELQKTAIVNSGGSAGLKSGAKMSYSVGQLGPIGYSNLHESNSASLGFQHHVALGTLKSSISSADIFPNPTDGKVSVKWSEGIFQEGEEVKLFLLSMNGTLLEQIDFQVFGSTIDYTLSMLPVGVYQLRIEGKVSHRAISELIILNK